MRIRNTVEPFVVFVKRDCDPGPGLILASVLASSPAEAVEIFRRRRTVDLPDRCRLDAFPARVVPGEGDPLKKSPRWPLQKNGRRWLEAEPGIWLYSPEITKEKVRTYEPKPAGQA